MHGHSFLIDKITNSIEDARTGKSYKTEVISVVLTDFKTVLKKNGWRFNWKKEYKYTDRQLYKIVVEGDAIIQL